MNKEFISSNCPQASYRLILLHGWGADAEDLFLFGRNLTDAIEEEFELVSFNAPQLHPSGIGRQWYPLFPPDWSQVCSAKKELRQRICSFSNSSIPLEKTFLLGFSQGGAMALDLGCELPLAGLIGCSAYGHPKWQPPIKRPPLLLSHGDKDEVVPLKASLDLVKSLKSSEIFADLLIFDGGHFIPDEVQPEFQNFIRQICLKN